MSASASASANEKCRELIRHWAPNLKKNLIDLLSQNPELPTVALTEGINEGLSAVVDIALGFSAGKAALTPSAAHSNQTNSPIELAVARAIKTSAVAQKNEINGAAAEDAISVVRLLVQHGARRADDATPVVPDGINTKLSEALRGPPIADEAADILSDPNVIVGARPLYRYLRASIRGQDHALREIANLYANWIAAGRVKPLVMFLVGTPGVGKTRIGELLARFSQEGEHTVSSRSRRAIRGWKSSVRCVCSRKFRATHSRKTKTSTR